MYSNNIEHTETNYQERYHRKNGTENKPIRKIKNYNTERLKRGAHDNQPPSDDYFTDHSYDTSKPSGSNSYYVRRNRPAQEESINNNKQSINTKNRINNIKSDYKTNDNDIMRINAITYYSEKDDKNKIKSVSSNKKNKNLENTLSFNNYYKSKNEDKNLKNMNRVELDSNKNNNGNLIFINSNKNTSIKVINKSKTNFSNLNLNNGNNDKIISNNRRKNKNELYTSENNLSNINNISNNNNSYFEKEYKFNKHSTKLPNNNKLIQMSNFEITYESDKGERNSYNSYKKNRSNYYNNNNNNNNKSNNRNNNKYKYNNVYYSNINLDEKNINEDNEIKANIYNNRMNQNNNPYKYQIVHNSNNNKLQNVNSVKKRININDSVEMKDSHNNKSVSLVSNNKGRNMKSTANYSNPRPLKHNQSNILKDSENKAVNYNYNRNNNNIIDIMDSNSNNNKAYIKNDIYTNMSIETPIIITNQSNISKKNSTNNFNNITSNNSNRVKKKTGNVTKKIKYKNYYRKSDIKKFILIQSVYKAHLLRSKLSNQIQIYVYIREFTELLYNILYIRKIKYWKFFIEKIIKKIADEINKMKNKRNYANIKKNQNSLYNANNKLILKTNEINMLHKELGDSFNIINDNNNGLKLKLDEMIKENTELKNQIFDNKNIEERLQQLLVENKKNQNINTIIMKDNQQLAKKLKNIQENRNNQLVIQNQSSMNMTYEDNLLYQSVLKLKYLFLKSLVFKKILKARNIQKKYFNKYRNNVKKIKSYKIENKNIFINNKKKTNFQVAKNSNLNYISQKDNYKRFLIYKLVLKKEKDENKIISKYFYNYFYITKCAKISEKREEEKIEKETKLIEDKKIQKKNLLQSIIDKYERNYEFLHKKAYKEWRLRSVIFKMKGVAKEIKKKKKLKKKIRDKMAKETLNNLKNKTAMFQSAHEFSYKIDKTNTKDKNNKYTKYDENQIKEENINQINEEKNEKNDNNNNNINNNEEQEDSEESFITDD